MSETAPTGDPKQFAERLADEIQSQGGSLAPAYEAFEVGISQFQQSGLPLEALIPAGERGLKFTASHTKDGKSFWSVYGKIVRNKLCTKNSKLQSLARSGAQLSAGSLVGVVMAALALPAAAIGIAAPIAAIIASLGIDAFCEYTKPPDVPRKHS
jgi:hypothetical protein